MQVHYNIDLLPAFKNAVITIGTFDGVHCGHQKIIEALLNETAAVGGESVIVTFDPHPRKVVDPKSSLQLINTLEEKIALLEKRGVDHLVVVPFDEDFALLSAEAYIKDFLVRYFKPHTIIIGYDHHFGRERKGNFSLLQEQQELWAYRLLEIPKHLLDEVSVSSTKIRTALLSGDVATANKLLGTPFAFQGLVVQGDRIGRTLGFPTANLVYEDEDKIRLGEGVYAVFVIVNGERKGGMLSIGKRPTLNDVVERVEVNIFDFDGNLYGARPVVMVQAYIRGQEKYGSLDELKEQIQKDKKHALEVLQPNFESS